MRYFFIILSVLVVSSCKLNYYYPSTQNRVEQVLGVTTQGDTIQVPINYFDDRFQSRYNYDIEYFFWRDNWWLYNQNLYNRWWWTNQPYWRPRPNRIIIPRQQPQRRIQTPRYQPRQQQMQPNRGRSNQVRQPKYVRPSNTRTQSNPTRSNTQSRTTNGGRVIKQ